MQILVIDNYDWGHCVPKLEKPKLATALEYAVSNLEPKKEVIVFETIEDHLE